MIRKRSREVEVFCSKFKSYEQKKKTKNVEKRGISQIWMQEKHVRIAKIMEIDKTSMFQLKNISS